MTVDLRPAPEDGEEWRRQVDRLFASLPLQPQEPRKASDIADAIEGAVMRSAERGTRALLAFWPSDIEGALALARMVRWINARESAPHRKAFREWKGGS